MNKTCISDLELWDQAMDLGMEGVPIAKLLLCLPTSTYFTDASGLGIGGYFLQNGQTWNFKFPPDILAFMTINHLKFLAIIVQLLLAEWYYELNGEHVLIWINNSTAICWLKKLLRSDKFALWLHRVLGSILLHNPFSLWGQHLPRDLNFVTDALSHSFSVPLKEMINDICFNCKTHHFNPKNPIYYKELPSHLQHWITTILHSIMQGEDLPPV